MNTQIFLRKCDTCGGEAEVVSSSEVEIKFRCKSCHKEWEERYVGVTESDAQQTHYLQARNEISMRMHNNFERNNNKLPLEIEDGIISDLDNLSQVYTNQSANDPNYHCLYIQLYTNNFTTWNKKIEVKLNTRLSKIQKSTYTKAEFEEIQTSVMSLKKIIESHKGKKKKLGIIFGSIVACVLITIVTVFTFFPQLIYGESTISYTIDGKQYTQNVVYSKKYEIEVPIKVGYTFMGLYDAEENGTQLVNSNGKSLNKWNSKVKNERVELYALFEIKEYIINFDTNGGDGNFVSYRVKYGDELSDILSTTIKTAFNFENWVDSNNEKNIIAGKDGIIIEGKRILNSNNYTLTADQTTITLKATWTPISYTITYIDEIAGNSEKTYTILDEFALISPSQKKLGYTGYWVVVSSKDGNWDLNEKIKEKTVLSGKYGNVELMLQYEISKYTITFDANGGIFNNTNMTISYNEKTNLGIATPSKTLYSEFVGWYYGETQITDANGEMLSEWLYTSDLTLTAIYKLKSEYSDYTKIYTASDLVEIRTNNSGKFILMNDIDMNRNAWISIETFSGIIDGAGYSINNLKIENVGALKNGCVNVGFIQNNIGTIKNLTFKNLEMNVNYNYDSESQRCLYAGLISINNGKLINIGVYNSNYSVSINEEKSKSHDAKPVLEIGGICGQNFGDIDFCIVKNSNITGCSNANKNYCEAYSIVGGLVGTNKNKVTNCLTTQLTISSEVKGGNYTFFHGSGDIYSYAGFLFGNNEKQVQKCVSYNNNSLNSVTNELVDNVSSVNEYGLATGKNSGTFENVYVVKTLEVSNFAGSDANYNNAFVRTIDEIKTYTYKWSNWKFENNEFVLNY